MTVAHLLKSLTSREIAEWEAHFRLEAEDAKRAELEAAAQAGVQGRRR